MEYYIRDRKTGHLWSGGAESFMGFRKNPFYLANHYASEHNALVGMATLLFKHFINKTAINDVIWEIVGHDPFTDQETVISITSEWWNNVIMIARKAKRYSRQDEKDSPYRRIRQLANAMRNDNKEWSAICFIKTDISVKDKKLIIEDFNEIDHVHVGKSSFLISDVNRVILSIRYAGWIDTITL